jgi:hypothetical protein
VGFASPATVSGCTNTLSTGTRPKRSEAEAGKDKTKPPASAQGSHSARSSPAFPAIPRRSKEGQGGCEKSPRGQGDARRAMEAPFIYRSTSVSSNSTLPGPSFPLPQPLLPFFFPERPSVPPAVPLLTFSDGDLWLCRVSACADELALLKAAMDGDLNCVKGIPATFSSPRKSTD